MERADIGPAFHAAADESENCGGVRPDRADALGVAVRRYHFQASHLRRLLRSYYSGGVAILQEFIIEYQAYTGGFNGITDYSNYVSPRFLWFILAVAIIFFLGARLLTHSKAGTVLKSIRDNDLRAEFLGYNVANYRIFVFCVSSFMAAAAGAMYAAWVGLVSFHDTGPVFSIEAVIWTAVGGRGTIVGPFVGTFLVKGAEFFLSGVLAEWWQILVGGLFIFVVLAMPDGIVGAVARWGARRRLALDNIARKDELKKYYFQLRLRSERAAQPEKEAP